MLYKSVIIALVLVSCSLFTASSPAEAMTINSELELLIDPIGDVFSAAQDGSQSSAGISGENLDIISMTASIGTYSVKPDDLILSMDVEGNIISTDANVRYIFLFQLDGESGDSYAASFSFDEDLNKNVVQLWDLSAGKVVVPPPSSEVAGGTLEIHILPSTIGSPSSLYDLKGASIDQRDAEKKYGDIAPDDLVKITSPSENSVIWSGRDSISGTSTSSGYTFEGVIYNSITAITSVEVQLDSGSWLPTDSFSTATSSSSGSWDYHDSSVTNTNGQHTISIKAEDIDGRMFEDSLFFYVDDSYVTDTNRPSFPTLPNLHVGDLYDFEVEGGTNLMGLDLGTESGMTMDVREMENIKAGTQTYETVNLHVSQYGSAVVGAFEMEQALERDSWRLKDNSQAVVKEYTVSSTSASVEGAALNTAYSFTNVTYDAPFDPLVLPKRVGDEWLASEGTTVDTRSISSEGEVTDPSPSSSTKQAYSEVLRKVSVSSSKAPILSGVEEAWMVRSAQEGDNEGMFTVSYFTGSYAVPVRIETYDSNRVLAAVITLERQELGDGMYSVIDGDIDWPMDSDIEIGKMVYIDVSLLNKGDTAGRLWVALLVDGVEVANVTTEADVAPEATATVTVEWMPSASGNYTLTILTKYDSQSMVIEVIEESVVDYTMYMMILVLAVVLVAVLLVAGRKRSHSKMLKAHDMKNSGVDVPLGGAHVSSSPPVHKAVMVSIDAATTTPKPAATAVVHHVQPEEKGIERTPIRCGKCGTVTREIIDKKPHKFKCPECGARLLIK